MVGREGDSWWYSSLVGNSDSWTDGGEIFGGVGSREGEVGEGEREGGREVRCNLISYFLF